MNAAAAAAATPIPGDFAAIPGIDAWDAEMFCDAYSAVTKAGCWENIKNFAGESFMFSRESWLGEVQKHMALMDQHSGCSYGVTMRNIESIAKIGWDAYVANRITCFNYQQKHAAAAT
jgi:hypothetical protein